MSTREKNLGVQSNGARRPLRALLVEDSELDAELLARALTRGGFALTWARVDTGDEMEKQLSKTNTRAFLTRHRFEFVKVPVKKDFAADLPFETALWRVEETLPLLLQPGAIRFCKSPCFRQRTPPRNGHSCSPFVIEPQHVTPRLRMPLEHNRDLPAGYREYLLRCGRGRIQFKLHAASKGITAALGNPFLSSVRCVTPWRVGR